MLMRKGFYGAAAAALIGTAATGALAAEVAPARAARVAAAPVAVAPGCAQFGGGYVGVQGGFQQYSYGWQDLDAFRGQVFGDDHQAPDGTSVTKGGGHAGGVVGFNWQQRCTVFGIEGDYNWASSKASEILTNLGHNDGDDAWNISSKLTSFGTIRLRTGVVVDNLLLYVTGGVGYARFNRSFGFFGGGGSESEAFSGSDSKWGWAAGVGTEWAFNPNWSLKSEVLYIGFTDNTQTFTSSVADPGVSYRFGNEDRIWASRVSLNYRWGG